MRRALRPGISTSTAAFSLLEVMVAVAILGLGLTVILTAQTGLFSSAKRAAQLSQAVGLARCKMAEVELQLLKEGYQLTVLMAEQNFTQAIRIADRGYVIVHGRIEFTGNSAAELNDNELIRQFYLGG